MGLYIGARTVVNYTRQLASGLSISIGFKNRTDGNIDIAINGMLSAKNAFILGIDMNGNASIVNTTGNNNTCLVLRGGNGKKNLYLDNILDVVKKLDIIKLIMKK